MLVDRAREDEDCGGVVKGPSTTHELIGGARLLAHVSVDRGNGVERRVPSYREHWMLLDLPAEGGLRVFIPPRKNACICGRSQGESDSGDNQTAVGQVLVERWLLSADGTTITTGIN